MLKGHQGPAVLFVDEVGSATFRQPESHPLFQYSASAMTGNG
jgi:hypothetical protein